MLSYNNFNIDISYLKFSGDLKIKVISLEPRGGMNEEECLLSITDSHFSGSSQVMRNNYK